MAGNILARDSIYFPGEFDPKMLETTRTALKALYHRKEQTLDKYGKASNALIVINSPGGFVYACEEIKQRMQHEKDSVKTDILVKGWACSAGAFLLTGATGHRYATPESMLLLHTLRAACYDQIPILNDWFRAMNYVNTGLYESVSESTGRPLKEIKEDLKADFELNALDAMFYGTKGLIDAIVVGPDQVLTKKTIRNYLNQWASGGRQARQYIEKRFEEIRDSDFAELPEQHKELEEDPLANPLQLVQLLVDQGLAQSISEVRKFNDSLSDIAGKPGRTMHLYKVASASS